VKPTSDPGDGPMIFCLGLFSECIHRLKVYTSSATSTAVLWSEFDVMSNVVLSLNYGLRYCLFGGLNSQILLNLETFRDTLSSEETKEGSWFICDNKI
jgi:hypothetical protein